MKAILDIVLFPIGVFLEAIVGLLYPARSGKMRKRRRWALISLAGCIGVLGTIAILAAMDPDSLAPAPLAAVALILMLTFLVLGKMCADEAEAEDDKKPDSC